MPVNPPHPTFFFRRSLLTAPLPTLSLHTPRHTPLRAPPSLPQLHRTLASCRRHRLVCWSQTLTPLWRRCTMQLQLQRGEAGAAWPSCSPPATPFAPAHTVYFTHILFFLLSFVARSTVAAHGDSTLVTRCGRKLLTSCRCTTVTKRSCFAAAPTAAAGRIGRCAPRLAHPFCKLH